MNSCTSVFSLFFKQIYFLSFPIGSMEKSSPMFSPDLIHDYLYGYKRIRLVSSEEVVTALQKGNSTFSLYHCCRNYEVFVLIMKFLCYYVHCNCCFFRKYWSTCLFLIHRIKMNLPFDDTAWNPKVSAGGTENVKL